MGGKTTTSTQAVQVPPEVLANYNQAYGTAKDAASQPFQAYGGQFVAPLTGTQQAGIANVNQAAGAAQPYYGAATGELMGAQGAAMPYYSQATGNVGAAQNVGNALAASSLGSLAQGQYNANPLQYQAAGQLSGAYDQAQSANQDAYNQYMGSQAAAQPLNYQALNTLGGAQGAGAALTAQGLNTLGQAGAAASPYNQQAAAAYQQAATAPQQFNQLAANQYFAGLGAANPLNQEAQALGEQSAQSINPTALNQSAIDQYMTPYMSSVVGSEQALLNQQNQQAMSGQLGNAIQAGAFGGDRSGIAAANLAQQQQIANANIYSNLLNQGYSQALSAAQQQQGVGLGAAQANRAAQAAAGQQLGSLAQQQYAQQTGTGQQLANLGQQVYSQPLGLGAAQAQLGQQIFGQGNTLAQQQLAAGQQLFGQGATTAQQQAALAQQLFGQGQTTGQNVAALGQQGFGQNITSAQAQAALAQQLYGQGATTAQQKAALGQQQYAQGIGAAQQLQGIGQGLYGMGSGTSASLANIGQGAQNSAIQGGQAQLAAGTTEQQTQQALNQALYNQFLQQQAYPFQTSQFLTNAALGLGTAQGSTTTTTQPGGFFSDKRLKENIREIGKDFSGKKLYRFNYKGDNKTHVGYIAQEIEKSAPEAVGESHGYKTVDYGKASEEAADRGHYYSGGIVPQSMGGHVTEKHGGEGYALGGSPSGIDATDFAAILAAQQQMFGPYAQSGRGLSGMPGAGSVVPGANIPVSKIATAPELHQNRTALENIKQATDAATGLNKTYETFKQPVQNAVKNAAQSVRKMFATPDQSKSTSDALSQTVPQETSSPSSSANIEPKNSYDDFDSSNDLLKAKEGGFIKTHRIGLAGGGIPYESDETGPRFGIPEEDGSHRLSALHFARGGLAGYASGGASDLPYASGEGQTSLDIPDENKNENKLQTAPGLAPQRTGLQNVSDAASTAASIAKIAAIFMAMSSGGVAGRRRRADGGTDDNQNDDSSVSADVKANTGLGAVAAAAPPPAQANAAAGLGKAAIPVKADADKTDKPTPWYKNADTLLPFLSGLAAMGTAPTRSLGVALASGVGAGAQSYQQQREFKLQQQQLGLEQQRVDVQKGQLPINWYLASIQGMKLPIEQTRALAEVMRSGYFGTNAALGIVDKYYKWLPNVGKWQNTLDNTLLGPGEYKEMLKNIESDVNGKVSSMFMNSPMAPPTNNIISDLTSYADSMMRKGFYQPDKVNQKTGVGQVPSEASQPSAQTTPQQGISAAAPETRPIATASVSPKPSTSAPAAVAPAAAVVTPLTAATAAPSQEALSMKTVDRAKRGEYGLGSIQQPIPPLDESNIADSSNKPSVLQKQINNLNNQIVAVTNNKGDPSGLQSQRQQLQDKLSSIMKSEWPVTLKDGSLWNGPANLTSLRIQNQTASENASQAINDQNKQSVMFNQNMYPKLDQALRSLADIYAENDANRLSDFKANLVGNLRSIFPNAVPQTWTALQEAIDSGNKNAVILAMNSAAQSGLGKGAPAATLGEALATVARPELSPGARYDLIGKARAVLDQIKMRNDDWNQVSNKVSNVSKFMNDWNNEQENQLPSIEKKIFSDPNFRYFAGMSDAERFVHPKQNKPKNELKLNDVVYTPKGQSLFWNPSANDGKGGARERKWPETRQ